MLGVPFSVEKPDVPEVLLPGEVPFDFPQRLSRDKAAVIVEKHDAGLVIAADTIVVHQGQILGKPRDEAEAHEMLSQLRGQQHRVLTGVTVCDAKTGKMITDVCDSKVTMREMSDEEIDAYVASGDPLDKAAAYAIQNETFAPVEQVIGCPANVMGLPMCHVVRSLRRHGYALPESKPCQCRMQFGGYYCEIAADVMPGLVEQGVIPH